MPGSVLMIISNYPPILGGAERQAHRLSIGLREQGWTVAVLTQIVPGLPAQENIDGVEVYRYGSPDKFLLKRLARYAKWFWFMVRHRSQYDVFHAHQPFSSAIVASIAGWLLKKPVVVKVTSSGTGGTLSHFTGSSISSLLFIWLRYMVRKFIAVNKEAQLELLSLNVRSDHVALIPNGIDTNQFQPPSHLEKQRIRQELEIGQDDIVLIFTGRLAPVKNVSYLVNVFHELVKYHKSRTEFRFLVVGDGEQRAICEAVSRNDPRICFLGYQSNVRRFLAASDIFVLADLREGLSNALLEAMSMALTPVVSGVGGNLDVVESGENGLHLPLHDPANAAVVLAELIYDKQLRQRLGTSAAQHIRLNYDIKRISQQYIDMYTELIHD